MARRGWPGTVGARPLDNSSCLILARIGEGRRDEVEARCASRRGLPATPGAWLPGRRGPRDEWGSTRPESRRRTGSAHRRERRGLGLVEASPEPQWQCRFGRHWRDRNSQFRCPRPQIRRAVAAAPAPELPGERCASLSAPPLASGRHPGICTEQGTGMRGRGRLPVLRPGVPQRAPSSPRRSRRGLRRPPAGPEGVRESSSGHIGRRLRQNSSLTQDVATEQTGVLHFAALRAAVPTGGRRSLAGGAKRAKSGLPPSPHRPPSREIAGSAV